MTNALRGLRIIWAALVSSVIVYGFVGEIGAHQRIAPNIIVFKSIALISVGTVGLLFLMRRFTVKSQTTLQSDPDNARAVARWRGGYIASYALCEAVALYGFVLRIEGFSLPQVAPFYGGGLLLLLWFMPRRPSLLDMATG